MATAKKTTKSAAPIKSTVIHELNEKGQHRIVSIGTCAAKGEWAAHTEIASLGAYRATTDHFKGVLPQGVFFAREVNYIAM